MRKLLASIALLIAAAVASAQTYTNFPNLQSGNMNFTATIRANGGACSSGTAIVSGGGSVSCVAVIPSSEKGSNNGVATLDSSGLVPTSQLPFSGLSYEGSWNANTNSPTLADGVGTGGDFYIANVAGTQDLGSGNITFAVGDWALYNGSIWQKVPSSAAVSSVFGRTGAVVAVAGDYTATQVANTPAGGIAATTVQAAIDELDTEKQSAASTLTSWAALTRASGFDTFTQTPSSANLRGLLTDEVGTGAAYFIGGALGTPASATLTNGTGLPWSTGLTGVPTTAVGYGITGGAKLDAYAGGDTPSAFTLGIVDSADAATWRAALGAGTATIGGSNTQVQFNNGGVLAGSSFLTWSGTALAAPEFSGGGASLTALNGTQVTTGTVADARLSSNVPLKNAANTFSASQNITVAGNAALTLTSSATPVTTELTSTSSAASLGVSTNHPLSFYTNNITRGSIAAAGNWTINAPASGTALAVSGNISSIQSNAVNINSIGTNTSHGAMTRYSWDSNIRGEIGTSDAVIVSGSSSNFGLSAVNALDFATANGVLRGNISSGGNWTINAPSSGTALTVNAVSGGAGLNLAAGAGVAPTILFSQSGQSAPAIYNPAGTDLLEFATVSGTATLLAGFRVGSPTGGDKGAGTLNTAGGIYQNNVSVCLNDGTNCGVLNASNISSGTLNNARLPATINAATDVQVGGVSVCRSNGTNCPSSLTLASGTWTPTITLTNGTGATTYTATYQRVGSIVNGGFIIGWDISAFGTTGAYITLPIASNFTNAINVVGSCNVINNAGNSALGARLYSDPTDDRMAVIFGWGSAEAGISVQCSYSYVVL